MEMSAPLPCLAMVHGVGAENQPPTATTLFSLAGAGTGGLALEEELKNKYLCPTPQGWILVHYRDAGPGPGAASTYLLDPHSRERVALPHLAVEQRLIPYCSCLLLPGVNPTAPGCPVLLVEPIDAAIWYCRVGDDGEWTRHEYDIGTVGDEYLVEKRVIAPIAACRGRFYFNPVPAETRVLELLLPRPGAAALAPEFGSVATTEPETEEDGFGTAKVFMVGTDDGELYKVVLARNEGSYDEARVFRMDFSESPHRWWRPVDELGGRAFFVAPMYFGSSCAVPVAAGGIRQDCVYSLVGAPKNSFRIFNVKDGTSQVCSLEEQQSVLVTAGKSRPCWVLPTQPRP